MALTQAQKDELVRSGKVSQYVGKSWDEVEKLLNSSSSGDTSSGSSGGGNTNNARTNGTDSGGNIWYTTPDGRQIAVRQGADVILDDNGYFLGTRTQSGRASYTGGSGSSSDQYDEQKKSLLSQLRASIAKAKSGYQNIINTAGQTYQPLRNQVSLGKEQQLQSLRESLANQGNRGGTGRQAMLNTETAAENQMNAINLQQQNTINDANRAIADIEQQGQFQESQLTAELAAQKLRELLAQEQRAGEMAEDTRRWESEFELRQQAAKDKAADELRNQFIDTIGQYANDYQARINELQNDGDPTNDWQIPYLATARQGKIDDANAKWQEQGYVSEDIAAALGKPVGTMTEAYKLKLQDAAKEKEVQNALKLFDDLGYVTPEMAAILASYGLPSDARTLNALKVQYSINKPYTGGDSYGLSW
jgi:hypothetical protein